MAEAVAQLEAVGSVEAQRKRSWLGTCLWFCKAKPLGAVGFVIFAVVLFCAVFGPGISIGGTEIIPGFTRYDPNENNVLEKQQPPSWDHYFGTDDLGRDVFTRVVHGARPSLQVGIFATMLGLAVGTVIGLFSGYARGTPDMLTQRFMDGVMAIPPLVLLLSLVSVTSPSLINIILILIIFIAPSSSRVVRGAVLSLKENQYVEASKSIGMTPVRTVTRHILPNMFAPIMVLATVTIGGAILVEAALSFLGLGVPPPTPTWGSMLSRGNAAGSFERAPWIALAPGIAITLTVLAFNLIGDALRDVLDPRLRGAR
jgi:peptide/nickel transport system permease protein